MPYCALIAVVTAVVHLAVAAVVHLAVAAVVHLAVAAVVQNRLVKVPLTERPAGHIVHQTRRFRRVW